MHEASLAQSIINIAVDEAKKAGCEKIKTVTIRVGTNAGVLKDALVFAFDALKEDTPAANALLQCIEVQPEGVCGECGEVFRFKGYIFVSPCCNSPEFRITRGRELEIVEIEAE